MTLFELALAVFIGNMATSILISILKTIGSYRARKRQRDAMEELKRKIGDALASGYAATQKPAEPPPITMN